MNGTESVGKPTNETETYVTLDQAILDASYGAVPPEHIKRAVTEQLSDWYAANLQQATKNECKAWVFNNFIVTRIRRLLVEALKT